MSEYLDKVLMKVIEILDLGLVWEKTEARIKQIMETKDEQQNSVFELIHHNTQRSISLFFIKSSWKQRYPLLLGFCYKLGIGTMRDEKKALKHWKKDTTSYGHYLVGSSYTYGFGVEINYNKALLKYKLSADAGNSTAQYNLAICYENADGVDIDLEKAVQWYQKSAEAGHSNAQYNLAICYEIGDGVDINLEKAVQWYQKSAEAGHSNAQYNLAICYQ